MSMTDDYLAPDLGAGDEAMRRADEDAMAMAGDQEPSEDALTPDKGQQLIAWAKSANIVPDLDDDTLAEIGETVKNEYKIDGDSRADWVEKTQESMDLAMQVSVEKNYPWPKSSNVIFPMLTTAAIQFASRAYPAIIEGRNVVKGAVVGDDSGQFDPSRPDEQGNPTMVVPPGDKQKRADKIGEHMSWQLLDEQCEWEEETDKKLLMLPIVGCSFRKTYFDSARKCNVSCLVYATNLVANYWARSVETAARLTEEIKLYPLEITEMERSGAFTEHEYGEAEDANGDSDAPHIFLEQHRTLDLDEDGYPEPYVVTVHKQSGKVARIVARYEPEGVHTRNGEDGQPRVIKIDAIHYYTKYDFFPNPEGGFYGVGLGRLLKPINESVNGSMNMMLDAGHLQNAGGGFIGKGLSMHGGAVKFTPGEFKTVNAPGNSIREAIVPLPFGGPSPVLFQLLGLLVESGEKISASTNVLAGESGTQQMQPTTLLALIEQGLKVFTSIYKRIHRALKKEYDKLYALNRKYLDDGAGYQLGDEWKTITREDYAKGSGVKPISDPNMVSDMQRMARTQFMLQFASDPMMDGKEIRRRALTEARIPDVDKLFAPPAPPQPDPQLMLAMAQVETDKIRGEAEAELKKWQAIETKAKTLKLMAEMDALVSGDERAWVQAQWGILQGMYEAKEKAAQEGSATKKKPATGDDAGSSSKTAPGPRQAPDGHYYVPDPNRPGKFLKFETHA